MAGGPAAAADPPEALTIADDPFQITDPRAPAIGEAELVVVGSWDRARSGRVRDTFGLESELAVGIARNFALRVGQAAAYGGLDARRRIDATEDEPALIGGGAEAARWGGLTRLGFLHQLAEQRGARPALALIGRVRSVYGPGQPAYEADAIALVGATIPVAGRPLGLHLNLGWTALLDPGPDERGGRYFLNASAGIGLRPDTVLVATFAREQQDRAQDAFQLIQVGIRHRLADERTVVGLALGAGIGRDSPALQVAVAVQWPLGASAR